MNSKWIFEKITFKIPLCALAQHTALILMTTTLTLLNEISFQHLIIWIPVGFSYITPVLEIILSINIYLKEHKSHMLYIRRSRKSNLSYRLEPMAISLRYYKFTYSETCLWAIQQQTLRFCFFLWQLKQHVRKSAEKTYAFNPMKCYLDFQGNMTLHL